MAQISTELASTIRRHVLATGLPLLRDRRATDFFHVVAHQDSEDDWYQLTLCEEEEDVAGIATYDQMAEYIGMSLEQLVQVLEERGCYTPSLEDEGDLLLADPHDLYEQIRDLSPWPALGTLLRGARSFSARMKNSPPLDLGEIVSDNFRPGDEMFYFATSPEALSCLQAVLDAKKRRTWISIEDQ